MLNSVEGDLLIAFISVRKELGTVCVASHAFNGTDSLSGWVVNSPVWLCRDKGSWVISGSSCTSGAKTDHERGSYERAGHLPLGELEVVSTPEVSRAEWGTETTILQTHSLRLFVYFCCFPFRSICSVSRPEVTFP